MRLGPLAALSPTARTPAVGSSDRGRSCHVHSAQVPTGDVTDNCFPHGCSGTSSPPQWMMGKATSMTFGVSARETQSETQRARRPMRYSLLLLGPLLTVAGANTALAAYCEGGQQPVPAAVAERMALPACGFAATHRWGPNGCQLCDSRNMVPNPFAGYAGHNGPRYQRDRDVRW